jgi:CBS domain-containing protein
VPVVSSHMTVDLLTVEPGTRLSEAAKRMAERGVGAVLVLDGDALAGILTERDLLKAVARGFSEDARVSDWMTRHPLMIHGGFRHLPVVEEGRPIGILSIRDLMRVALQDSAPRGV